MKFLKRHPFPVVARFDRVVAVSFAFPEATLRPLLPEALEIDSYKGFGFVTVALVWTRELRPAGLPRVLGQDFFLAGYRIFARLRAESGRRLRGLKILRSETDKRQMVWLGNLMTGYRYRYVILRMTRSDEEMCIETFLPGGMRMLALTFAAATEKAHLPENSPFEDWHAARRFAGPMPFTFSPEPDGSVIVIEGMREDWTPRPVAVKNWDLALFDEEPFREAKPILANAFEICGPIAYRWRKGRVARPTAT